MRERFLKYVQKTKTCWNWTGATFINGYGCFSGPHHPTVKGRIRYAHRNSWLIFKGDLPPGMYVLHKCHNRKCVNPKHLYLGTHNDNMRDMAKHGSQKGERNPAAVISKELALKILASPVTNIAQLARELDLKYGLVYQVKKRLRWRHL